MDKSSSESCPDVAYQSPAPARRRLWPAILLALSMMMYLGIFIGVPLAFCLFGSLDYPDLFHVRRSSAVLYSGFASYVMLLAIWVAIGPGPWSRRTVGSITFLVMGLLIAYGSYSAFEPVRVQRVTEAWRALYESISLPYNASDLPNGQSMRFSSFLSEMIGIVSWFAATASAMLAIRCWFGWLLRRTAEPVGRRNARRVRMMVLLSVVAIALATHLSLQLNAFGRNQQAAQSLVLMIAFFTVPATFLAAALLWAMFSNGRRKTRGTVAALTLATVLMSYAFVSSTMFRGPNLRWEWPILIAVIFAVPFFAALFAIRGFGYRITPYSRSDFVSAAAEPSSSPFDD